VPPPPRDGDAPEASTASDSSSTAAAPAPAASSSPTWQHDLFDENNSRPPSPVPPRGPRYFDSDRGSLRRGIGWRGGRGGWRGSDRFGGEGGWGGGRGGPAWRGTNRSRDGGMGRRDMGGRGPLEGKEEASRERAMTQKVVLTLINLETGKVKVGEVGRREEEWEEFDALHGTLE